MKNKITILDGGMGRLLKEMGAPFQQPEWSALALIDAPDFVTKAHQAYIDAGAEIITTNAYALIPFHIGQARFDDEGPDLIKLAAQLARDTAKNANHKVQVAGSLPPAFGSYRPDYYDDQKAYDIYKPLIENQTDDVDFFLAETLSTTKEAYKIASIMHDLSDKPLWLSFSLKDREGQDIPPQLRSGELVEEAIKAAIDTNASALLFNCSQTDEMEDALSLLKDSDLGIPYGVYANAFDPISNKQQANEGLADIRQETTPENYLKYAEKWASQGTTIIGGCCGIGPDHITELKKLNNQLISPFKI